MDLAEDAVQETLLAALEGMDSFAGGPSASTWVHGILRHKIVDCMRATGRETPLDAEQPDVTLDDPHRELEEQRLFEAVERRLQLMPANIMLYRARRHLRECPEIRGLAADAI